MLSLDHLRDPRIEGTTPLAITTRTPREWQPSVQALENIATNAEQAFRTGKTLMFSPIDPHVFMDIDEQLLLERRPGADYAFIYSVKNNAKTRADPLTRTQYQAATPSTFIKSRASPHAKYWALARKREVISNLRLETLGPLLKEAPPGKRPLPTSFVYKNKWTGDECLAPEDLPEKSWKARVVVKGYLMVLDRDYHETFAPTASASSIRLIAAIAANYAMPLKAADFETAFLNSPMDTVVYVTTPAGFEQWAKHGLKGIEELPSDFLPGDEPEPVGCRLLLKGIPGIKQGSRLFYQDMRKFWLDYGFTQLPADPCVFYRVNADGLTLVGVWVDDLIAAVPNDAVWNAVIAEIRKKFPVADKGKATLFLGMDIVQSDDFCTVTLSQKNSIEDLLERAGMTNCNPAATPCVAGMVWTKQDCPEVVQPFHPEMPIYRGVLALALFISNWTVPPAVYAVNKLCKYMANPGDKHVAALKRLLRYFAAIKDHGLVYTRQASPQGLVGFSDSSHMDCPDTSRSTVAFVFFFNDCVISWYSKLHGYVTTCTNHSEYAALFVASKEAFHLIEWLRPLQDFLKLSVEPTTIFLDNDGARALSQNPVGTALNKHVRMMHHYTRELVEAGTIKTCDVDTTANCADVFTKALGPQVFPTHARRLASDTTAALVPPLVVLPAHVMMIRGVEVPARARKWPRWDVTMADVGVQCDLPLDPAPVEYFTQVTRAVSAAVEFSEEIHEVSEALATQHQLITAAEAALHASVLDIVQERVALLLSRSGLPPDTVEQFPLVNQALSAVVKYSKTIATVSESMLAQRERIVTAGNALHADVENINLRQEEDFLDDQMAHPTYDPEYDERPLGPLAPPRLSDVPRGVFYVCHGEPSKTCTCESCIEADICDLSKWDLYRPRAPHCISLYSCNPKCHTISGLYAQLNSIVVGYLGYFCTSTYVAYVNPPPRENFCNYCRVDGHHFDLQDCTRDAEERLDTLHLLARRSRNEARLAWCNHPDNNVINDALPAPQAQVPLPVARAVRRNQHDGALFCGYCRNHWPVIGTRSTLVPRVSRTAFENMVAQPSPGAFATIVFSFKLRIAKIAIPPKSLSSSAGRNSHVFSFPHLPCLSRGVVSR